MSALTVQKKKASWTPKYCEIFIDICLEETLKGNKPGTNFTKKGWSNIVESFHKRAADYDRKQIRNHWDVLTEQWKIWCMLTREVSMKWEPQSNTFGASDEEWAKYLEENPEAAQFRFKKLRHTEKLKIIFGASDDDVELLPRCKKRRDSLTTLHQEKEPDTAERGMKNDLCDASKLNSRNGRRIASGQSTATSSFSKGRASWTPPLHEIFLDLCLEQTLKGNRSGTCFNKEGWRNIIESFDEKAGVRYDRKQIKNHWDMTKEQWKIWCKLVGTSSMKWNPNSKQFGATEEDWSNYIKTNPEASQFQFKNLQHADKLGVIFDATLNTGESNSQIQPIKPNDSSVTSLLQTDEQGITYQGGNMEHHYEGFESRTAATVSKSPVVPHSLHFKHGYSIGECIECLDEMEEVEQGGELYLFALDIFLKKEYREIFLQLKKPSVRISWLQRLRSVGPLLH